MELSLLMNTAQDIIGKLYEWGKIYSTFVSYSYNIKSLVKKLLNLAQLTPMGIDKMFFVVLRFRCPLNNDNTHLIVKKYHCGAVKSN